MKAENEGKKCHDGGGEGGRGSGQANVIHGTTWPALLRLMFSDPSVTTSSNYKFHYNEMFTALPKTVQLACASVRMNIVSIHEVVGEISTLRKKQS